MSEEKPNTWHITNVDDEWRVFRNKNTKATKIFKTQQEAIDYAKVLAKNNNGNILIHKKDGKIRQGHNYAKKSPKK